jgi:hypothetical protein
MRIYIFLDTSWWKDSIGRVLRFLGWSRKIIQETTARGSQGVSEQQIADMLHDLPVPVKGRLDPDHSAYAGPAEDWVGRLVFHVRTTPDEVCQFYQEAMPDFGWRMICATRSDRGNVVNFVCGTRGVSIQVDMDPLRGCNVTLILVPHRKAISIWELDQATQK